ncbi:hypothetical protein J5N97_006099 [Dioscorea zingiberensis]|uniref:Pentatricopeptide repeat-containing protein n=1 Tax=Dioscorea zingiberensis TaxID=325984 RepID=A0A9D5DBC4_9LILI|nr:hypothetical protein J5N97_006099 [Dioscorea zingiberensis]
MHESHGACSYARQLFDEMPNWDVVSATSIIGSFARQGRYHDAVSLFSRVLLLGIRPNEFTFGTTLYASTALGDLNIGKQLHAYVTKMGLQSNVFVGSSLLDHYAKVGTIRDAQCTFEGIRVPNVVAYTALINGYLKNAKFGDALKLFRRMPERNVVSWNAMIGGCSQMGLNEESVNLFVKMCRDGMKPTDSTFACLFSAAANIAALGMGRSFHSSAIKSLAKLDVFVGNSLISFYSKCGCLEDSVRVFDRLKDRNVVSWNAVICGYAQNGKGVEALEFFRRMRLSGLKPNSVTLLGLLFGCNHAGLVDDGYSYFKLAMIEEPHILKPEHYACVINLLSRSGQFNEAKRFLQELPFDPGIGFWKALLGGCQIHLNKDMAEAIAHRILELDPKDISSYVQLSNVYSSAGRWQSVSAIRREMKERGMKRVPGCSWIEVRNKVHVFFNADRRHPQTYEIYETLMAFMATLESKSFHDLHY